ncbi:MAG: DUF6602 domain-containing protein [Pseudomonadota bacterium]
MNNYEDWAQLVAKNLKGEAELIAAIEKDELEDGAATAAFIRAVLEPFLPENFGIGSGRVVDAFGNYSDHLDIIIYNRDFPRIGLRATHSAYLYESVLATFVVRAKFIRKTFFESMDACASLAGLQANIDKTVLVRLAKKNGLKAGPNKTFVHEDPLRTARFHLIGRPPAFVYGFGGIKNSYRQLQQNIELWVNNRQQAGIETDMKALPAVIATQGCFAWRNAAPLALSNRDMLGIGNDPAPVRLIVLQLLYLLNRRLNVSADGYGIRPNLKAYLSQFSPPEFALGICNIENMAPSGSDATEAKTTENLEAAKDHAPTPAEVKPDTPALTKEKPEAAAKAQSPKAEFQAPPPKTAPLGSAPIPGTESAPIAENAPKTAPLGSAPIPGTSPSSDTPPKTAPLGSAPIPGLNGSSTENAPKTAPLGSAPIPTAADTKAENTPKTAPLGSAPIPMAESPKPAATPPKPPVDIDFGGEVKDEAAAEDPFESTMVIPPPNAAGEAKKKPENIDKDSQSSRSSTDAFIARVKEQLSSSEALATAGSDQDQDPFTSTIPQ